MLDAKMNLLHVRLLTLLFHYTMSQTTTTTMSMSTTSRSLETEESWLQGQVVLILCGLVASGKVSTPIVTMALKLYIMYSQLLQNSYSFIFRNFTDAIKMTWATGAV